jgi:hypothetical protein
MEAENEYQLKEIQLFIIFWKEKKSDCKPAIMEKSDLKCEIEIMKTKCLFLFAIMSPCHDIKSLFFIFIHSLNDF